MLQNSENMLYSKMNENWPFKNQVFFKFGEFSFKRQIREIGGVQNFELLVLIQIL